MKEKGFSLIELLAVIVILAIIALVAVPIVLTVIEDSKDSSNERSIEMYAHSIKNSVAKNQLESENNVTGNFYTTDGKNLILIGEEEPSLIVDYNGNVTCDTIEIYDDGSMYLANCKVNGEPVDYTYGEQYKYICKAVSDITTPNKPPYSGYNVGDAYDCEVKDGTWYRFYILSTDDEYVNLIAQQNITAKGVFTGAQISSANWNSPGDNRYGPQTAYTYLQKATQDWTNIPIIENFSYLDEGHEKNSNYGYQSIITQLDKSTGKYITTITPYSNDYGEPKTYENMKVRLPSYKEIVDNVVTTDGIFPLWMVNYLYSSTNYPIESGKVNGTGNNNGYWILSSVPGYSARVYCVKFSGYISYDGASYVRYGLRPVITISKSNLLPTA